MTVEIRALAPEDDRTSFSSGDEALDLFFRRYAGQHQFRHHVGVSYVAVEAGEILGFVKVSPGSLDAGARPSGRRMPPYPRPLRRRGQILRPAQQEERLGEHALHRQQIPVLEPRLPGTRLEILNPAIVVHRAARVPLLGADAGAGQVRLRMGMRLNTDGDRPMMKRR